MLNEYKKMQYRTMENLTCKEPEHLKRQPAARPLSRGSRIAALVQSQYSSISPPLSETQTSRGVQPGASPAPGVETAVRLWDLSHSPFGLENITVGHNKLSRLSS